MDRKFATGFLFEPVRGYAKAHAITMRLPPRAPRADARTVLLLTGLTRDGVYLVEDGEVTAAVNNFRFNESPLDLLRRATEASVSGTTLPREWGDWATRAAMPSLRIPDFHMSSVSQAQ